MLGAVGTTVWVQEEDALDVVTALSGSGPAYFFLLAELMTDAAVNLGLDRASAQELASRRCSVPDCMARDSDGDLARLRAEVTSKGGTTEAAVRAFDAANLRGIVAAALAAATDRGREMAQAFGNTNENMNALYYIVDTLTSLYLGSADPAAHHADGARQLPQSVRRSGACDSPIR